jgi:predicted phage gp36 major capsid-like protein
MGERLGDFTPREAKARGMRERLPRGAWRMRAKQAEQELATQFEMYGDPEKIVERAEQAEAARDTHRERYEALKEANAKDHEARQRAEAALREIEKSLVSNAPIGIVQVERLLRIIRAALSDTEDKRSAHTRESAPSPGEDGAASVDPGDSPLDTEDSDG